MNTPAYWGAVLLGAVISLSETMIPTPAAVAEDVPWAKLTEMTRRKGLTVNSNLCERFSLPAAKDNKCEAYQAPYDESDFYSHHLNVLMAPETKNTYLVASMLYFRSNEKRYGYAFYISQNGDLLQIASATYDTKKSKWDWSTVDRNERGAFPEKAMKEFAKESEYWLIKQHYLEKEPDQIP